MKEKDESTGQSGIFRFAGKEWNRETDPENVNYDYLIGADLDTDCPETVAAVTNWGKWYLDTVHPDGLRLDGDYYWIPHDGVAPVPGLKKLLKLRERFAYGEQLDYFDDPSVVGFTRLGEKEHPGSGMAVLVTDSAAGEKRMYVGKRFAGRVFYDVLAGSKRTAEIDAGGWGVFSVDDGAAAVWVAEQAYQ